MITNNFVDCSIQKKKLHSGKFYLLSEYVKSVNFHSQITELVSFLEPKLHSYFDKTIILTLTNNFVDCFRKKNNLLPGKFYLLSEYVKSVNFHSQITELVSFLEPKLHSHFDQTII